jgi:predicted site-specific integrase-resolvase
VAPHAPLVSQSALADRLDVSIATLARARKRGLLVGHLIGGQWRFTEQQIANYLKLTEPSLSLYGRRSNENDSL